MSNCGMDFDVVPQDMNDTLIGWQVCARCRIRLLNETVKFESFIGLEEEENWICYICCGILQSDSVSNGVIDKIASQVNESEYEFNSFQVVVSTPINLLIREHAVCVVLKEMYPTQCEKLFKDEKVTIKSVWRHMVKERLSASINRLYINGNQVQAARSSKNLVAENEYLVINVSFSHTSMDFECSVLAELDPEQFRRRRKGEHRYKWDLYTRPVVEKLLGVTTAARLRLFFSLPPNHLQKDRDFKAELNVELCRQDPMIVAGRYRKLSRRLPQSPWILDGERRLESSVEELIVPHVVGAFRATSGAFLAAGREDVDVRMLGTGRPFAFELRDCQRMPASVTMETLEAAINETGLIEVSELSVVSRDSLGLIKLGEQTKCKRYRMVVWCQQGGLSSDAENGNDCQVLSRINAVTDLLVQQLTPIRVLHRRSLIDRPRTFYSFSAVRLDKALQSTAVLADESLRDYQRFLDDPTGQYRPDQLFVLTLRCQAGSYVKEFVHGDLGRTRPNLASIINQPCDILALDVLEIELEWPPKN